MKYFFDGTNKIINLTTGTTMVSVRDLWSRYVDWVITGDNSKYQIAMNSIGGDSLPGSKKLGLTYFLTNGWKIRPYEGNHTLDIEGNLYSEDGSSPYVNVLGSYNVMIINSVSSLVDSTVQQLPEIEYSSYNEGVTLDTVNGTDSHEYPFGTPKYPCKTINNSYMIRMSRGFKKIYLKSDLILSEISDGVLVDLELIGITGFKKHLITVNNVLITNCKLSNIKIIGNAKNGSILNLINCEVRNLENVNLEATDCFIFDGMYKNTELFKCRLEGNIKVVNGGKFSGINIVFSGDTSSIDCIGSTSIISLDIDSGYIKIKNSVSSCLLEFNLKGGELELDSTCNGGDFYAEGYGTLYGDPVTLGMNVKSNHLLSLESIPVPIWEQVIEGTYTASQLLRLLSSINMGKTIISDNGNDTATITFKGLDGITNRVISNINNNQRSNVTLLP